MTIERKWMALLAAMALAACKGSAPPPPPAVGPLARWLPEKADAFAGGALETKEAFARREYTKGAARISVTVARVPTTQAQFDEWTRTSAAYPPAILEVPPGTTTGFYACAGVRPDGWQLCDLHIQTRSGFHVEVMGNGTATRPDLEQLMRGIPLRGMADAP
jgi:hypothetical protein